MSREESTGSIQAPLLGLCQGPMEIEVTVRYGDRTIFQQALRREASRTKAQGAVHSLALVGGGLLALAAALFAWRLSEVRMGLKHHRSMKSWARTHVEALPFVPVVPKRPFLEAGVLVLTAFGLMASVMAVQKHRLDRAPTRFMMGEGKHCSFPSPDRDLPESFPLVQAHATGFKVQIPPSAEGKVILGTGDVMSLAEALSHPIVEIPPDRPSFRVLDLPARSRCELVLGPATVSIEDVS